MFDFTTVQLICRFDTGKRATNCTKFGKKEEGFRCHGNQTLEHVFINGSVTIAKNRHFASEIRVEFVLFKESIY